MAAATKSASTVPGQGPGCHSPTRRAPPWLRGSPPLCCRLFPLVRGRLATDILTTLSCPAWAPRRCHTVDPFLPCVGCSLTQAPSPLSARLGHLSAALRAATLRAAWLPGGRDLVSRRRLLVGASLQQPSPPRVPLRRGLAAVTLSTVHSPGRASHCLLGVCCSSSPLRGGLAAGTPAIPSSPALSCRQHHPVGRRGPLVAASPLLSRLPLSHPRGFLAAAASSTATGSLRGPRCCHPMRRAIVWRWHSGCLSVEVPGRGGGRRRG